MKLSYNWLKQLTYIKKSPEQLADLLSMHIASVEKITNLGQGMNDILVSKIIKIKPHPHADRLQLVVVKTTVNNRRAMFEVVCGAQNIVLGQKVPLALPGARLADGTILKSSVIRGIKSEGMLCAEDELGIGDDHTGIYILNDNVKLGQSVVKVLGLNDSILEIENKSITHRPDLFNHIGFAREICALTGSKIRTVKSCGAGISQKVKLFNRVKNTNKKFKYNLDIKIKDFKLCPRYMAVVMDNIKVNSSPEWMQRQLQSIGIRPINNIVDITNYILMEYGQPLHTFDFNKVSGGIVIRPAKNKEELLALDGEKYKLDPDDLVIADNKHPIAVAGIIGGELSGISDNTKTIIIESANFNYISIRRTSRKLGIRTESALRFEKGLPLNFPETGIFRAIELIKSLTDGRVASKIYDIKSKQSDSLLNNPVKIVFDFNKARNFIGLNISNTQMIVILKRLGCKIRIFNKKVQVEVPGFRPDLNIFEDIIEEIVRVYGTDKINPVPIINELKPILPGPEFSLEKKIKNILIGCGFDELYNYSFYGHEKKKNNIIKGEHLQIANPLNPNSVYLRTSLIPLLLDGAKKNSANFSTFRIFEIGNVFNPQETKKMAGLIFNEKEGDIYFIIKGILELIFDRVGINIEKVNYKSKERGITDIIIDNKFFGIFGIVKNNIGIFELDFDILLRNFKTTKTYKQISIYPQIKRDLAFLINKGVKWSKIVHAIKNINPLIQEIELFDVFENKKFGNRRNIAFHIIYQSYKRTLKSNEVNKIQKEIIKILHDKFNAELRDF